MQNEEQKWKYNLPWVEGTERIDVLGSLGHRKPGPLRILHACVTAKAHSYVGSHRKGY